MFVKPSDKQFSKYLVMCPVQAGVVLSLGLFIINSRNFKADYKNNPLIVWKTLADKLVVLYRNT